VLDWLNHDRDSNRVGFDQRKDYNVKADKFDYSTSWSDFKSHFDIYAELNGWTSAEKVMYLAVALRDRAQSVLGSLPEGEKCNYRLL
jgi:hypothetical protein